MIDRDETRSILDSGASTIMLITTAVIISIIGLLVGIGAALALASLLIALVGFLPAGLLYGFPPEYLDMTIAGVVVIAVLTVMVYLRRIVTKRAS